MADTSTARPVALVTGASSGMGKETANRFLEEGLVVYVAARRLAQMEDLKALGAIPLQMDISVDADIVAAVHTIEAAHGGIDEVAQRLAMSKRSLQRQLAQESVGFQDVLNQVRQALAQHYLSRTDLSAAEIAWLLGFQESNSFVRAFRGWTGATPSVYRKERVAANAHWH